MVWLVFKIHMFFHEIAAFILKMFAVEGKDFSKQAGIDLLIELVYRITIDKIAFSGSLGMQI